MSSCKPIDGSSCAPWRGQADGRCDSCDKSDLVSFGAGPNVVANQAFDWQRLVTGMQSQAISGRDDLHICACIGPRPGQTKCPCALRGESEKGAKMVRDGVIIDGVHYDLVRRDPA